ncbi:GDSL-type esterase/lipase family protein [Tundrisphaera lichenicola]|uniref:GDSL-type esterase/lipase family protein n=1 Tax=Tundrisphaera lichenicola TaxID=2029860 RepID=UPI003EB91865
MKVRSAIRGIQIAFIAVSAIGLAEDFASGARSRREDRADRPAVRSGEWEGDPDRWTQTHQNYVDRARRADADLVFLGDSIFYAWGDDSRNDLGHPSWRSEFAPLKAVNFGFPGDQTQHLLHRIDDGELDGHPRVAVVLIGTNNLTSGQSVEATASGIAAVVDRIRQASPSTRILLLGLLPRGSRASDPLRVAAGRVNEIIERWASRTGVDYLDVGASFLRPDGRIDVNLMMDDLHPSPGGYQSMAEALRDPIRRLLGVGRSPIALNP